MSCFRSGVFPCLPIAPFTVHVFVLSPAAVQWTYTSCFNPYIINDIDYARGRFYHSKRFSHTNKDIAMRWSAGKVGWQPHDPHIHRTATLRQAIITGMSGSWTFKSMIIVIVFIIVKRFDMRRCTLNSCKRTQDSTDLRRLRQMHTVVSGAVCTAVHDLDASSM